MSQLRSANNDLNIYQPYQSPIEGSPDTSLRFLKIPSSHIPSWSTDTDYDEGQETRVQPLRVLNDIDNYSVVFMPGRSPSFIIKSALSPPQIINLRAGPVRSLSRLNTSKCEKGFVYIDESVSLASLNSKFHIESGRVALTQQTSPLKASTILAGSLAESTWVRRSRHLTIIKERNPT